MTSIWIQAGYALAIAIIALPQIVFSADVPVDAGAKDKPPVSTSSRQIDKAQAKEIIMKATNTSREYFSTSVTGRRIIDCTFALQLDSIFSGGIILIDENSLNERMGAVKLNETQAMDVLSCGAMTTDDFRLDYVKLEGKPVMVEGEVLFMMNIFMLKKSNMDLSPIPIDVSKITREEQKQILQKCATLTSRCKGLVLGTAGKVTYQNGILADGIVFKK